MEISTSILSAEDRKETILKLNKSATDYIHFDVMDGEFVLNKQFSIPELKELLEASKKKNDVHLMVKDPLKYVEAIKDLNVEYITIHAEIGANLENVLSLIKANNIKCGLALDLNSDISLIKPYLNLLDLVLIMTVKAGYGGQEFKEEALEKIKELPENIKIEIDGGINEESIKLIPRADIIVSGTFVLQNIAENILALKRK